MSFSAFIHICSHNSDSLSRQSENEALPAGRLHSRADPLQPRKAPYFHSCLNTRLARNLIIIFRYLLTLAVDFLQPRLLILLLLLFSLSIT